MSFQTRLLGRTLKLLLFAFGIAIRYAVHYQISFLYSKESLVKKRADLHRRQAAKLTARAIQYRGVLIKLGQFLSARVDILPDEFSRELTRLQDAVPPADPEAIRQRIKEELGADPQAVFDRFDPSPIAAASLGQVHEAVLKTGQRVAVKVQYPDIEEIVEMDLRAVRWALWWLSRWYRHIHWDILYNEFSAILHQELDYIQEGNNAETFRKNHEDDDRIIVPKVIWDYTTSHILTLEFVEGIKISDYDAVRQAGVALPELARLLVESYMIQIFQHRFMHGDPHPGNLFVRPGPKLVFVDFGLMQPMAPPIREGIRMAAGGIIERDIPRIMKGLTTLGFVARDGDLAPIERVAVFFIEKYRDISPKSFQNIGLQDITEDMEQLLGITSEIQMPNNFILIWRTAGMLNGLCSKLDPELNIIELAKPYALPFIKKDDEGFAEELFSKGKELMSALLVLPTLLEKFLVAANRGEFKTKMSSEDVTGALSHLYRLLYRSVLGVFLAGFWFASPFLEQYTYHTEAVLSKVIAFGLGILLVASFVRRGKA